MRRYNYANAGACTWHSDCMAGRHAGSTARRERHSRPPGQRDWQTREHRVQVHEEGEGAGQAFQRWMQHHQRQGIFQER
ncbi:unnamed protein product [Ectocarpus sp. CCAP 1310/34]|nr:unnamed protein product [Ectocarpus sp. CCAP 1310/34]